MCLPLFPHFFVLGWWWRVTSGRWKKRTCGLWTETTAQSKWFLSWLITGKQSVRKSKGQEPGNDHTVAYFQSYLILIIVHHHNINFIKYLLSKIFPACTIIYPLTPTVTNMPPFVSCNEPRLRFLTLLKSDFFYKNIYFCLNVSHQDARHLFGQFCKKNDTQLF